MIEGKVAQIISESHVVINAGASAGVKPGMLFAILAEGAEVKDPETGQSLGKWEMPKGHIKAIHVQDTMSVCEAVSAESDSEADISDPSTRTLSASMVAVSMPERARTAPKLNVRRGDIAGMPEAGPTRVGDKVRQVEGS